MIIAIVCHGAATLGPTPVKNDGRVSRVTGALGIVRAVSLRSGIPTGKGIAGPYKVAAVACQGQSHPMGLGLRRGNRSPGRAITIVAYGIGSEGCPLCVQHKVCVAMANGALGVIRSATLSGRVPTGKGVARAQEVAIIASKGKIDSFYLYLRLRGRAPGCPVSVVGYAIGFENRLINGGGRLGRQCPAQRWL